MVQNPGIFLPGAKKHSTTTLLSTYRVINSLFCQIPKKQSAGQPANRLQFKIPGTQGTMAAFCPS